MSGQPTQDRPEPARTRAAPAETLRMPDPGVEVEKSPVPPLELSPGDRPIPGYQLVALLGRGGFGEVWKAVGPGGFAVALKFLRLEDHTSAAELRSLEVVREIRHPHLLAMFGSWQLDGRVAIAMELGDRTLYQRFQEARASGLDGIPLEELIEYMREAAKGLDYLHSLGIQHRDLKPQNFLLVGGGLKVADFGLARLLESSFISSSAALTPAYAAPEFFQGQATPHSDQYSLAVTYCQLRGGRLPFEGNPMQLMFAHIEQPPDLTMLPEPERPSVARALAKKPDERWPSCRAFVRAVAVAAGVPDAATTAPPREAVAPAPPSGQRGRVGRWLAAAALLVAMGAAVVVFRDHIPGLRSAGSPPGGPTSSGTGTAGVTGSGSRGGPSGPPSAGSVRLVPPERVALRAGRSVTIEIGVERDNGPNSVRVTLDGLPAGVSARFDPEVAADRRSLPVELTARRDAPAGTATVAAVASAGEVRFPSRFPVEVERPPLEKVLRNSAGMTLVLIPPGTFRMGSPPDEPGRGDDESPREVPVAGPFYLGAHEVTQEQYEAVMGSNPAWFAPGGEGRDTVRGVDARRLPVESVSWSQAEEFCRRLSARKEEKEAGLVYRLPTEAEWEYACRAGTATPHHFSADQLAVEVHALPRSRTLERPVPVGSHTPNAWGLYDLHGNVFEWCQDWYDAKVLPGGKEGPGDERVIRGGAWSHGLRHARSAARNSASPDTRAFYIGFRVAATAE